MTAIIDYDAGNVKSVGNALLRLGAEFTLSADLSVLSSADRLILPGVGNDARAMESLADKGLCDFIRNFRKPVLGICVGMQIMCRHSEEGDCKCLGIFDTDVRRFPEGLPERIPHMGWNSISNLDCRLLKGLEEGERLYFVHSYYASLCCDTAATCVHGGLMFSAVLRYENFYGTQFHPEKSGAAGARILQNFLSL